MRQVQRNNYSETELIDQKVRESKIISPKSLELQLDEGRCGGNGPVSVYCFLFFQLCIIF